MLAKIFYLTLSVVLVSEISAFNVLGTASFLTSPSRWGLEKSSRYSICMKHQLHTNEKIHQAQAIDQAQDSKNLRYRWIFRFGNSIIKIILCFPSDIQQLDSMMLGRRPHQWSRRLLKSSKAVQSKGENSNLKRGNFGAHLLFRSL